ncbi:MULTISPECIES: hypothetical protein [unclassified Amycolatopsis]|uniref:hypothetical protein n=1 Tax=unclassified Amycolatopsis TaxID=2618356 RepID=UPI002875CB2B|nr:MULTISPECIES: hypothetical protein [unclassified Amycolatopsis]MDS0132359.1 hypothetical protein [Amycolatopsis sp. 505]MDS0142817.1 hypothetical protein [Amycolatopsis sp. CM201R]
MPSAEFESAAASFKRLGQDAVTHSRRVAGNALARGRRQHSENAELLKQSGRGPKSSDPTPGTLRAAAERFRRARGLTVPAVPDPVPSRSQSPARAPRSGDDDEDFSQMRIMQRDR